MAPKWSQSNALIYLAFRVRLGACLPAADLDVVSEIEPRARKRTFCTRKLEEL